MPAVRFGGIAIDLFKDGMRVDGWAQFDRLGLLRQLGAVETDGPFASRRTVALPEEVAPKSAGQCPLGYRSCP